MARLVDIEKEIKSMIAEDRNNPEIFNKIFDLIYFWFLRKHIFTDFQDTYDVSLWMAEDFYMRVLENREFHSWLGYLSLCYHWYIRQWRKQKSEIIDTSGDENLEEAIWRMCSASSMDNENIELIFNDGYLKSIPNLIPRILENSHFYPDTPEYLNAHLTLLLSVYNGWYCPYNLDEHNERYVRILYRMFIDKLAQEICPKYNDNSLSLLQSFILEDSMKDGD